MLVPVLLVACGGSHELREIPRGTLVTTSGFQIDVVRIPEGAWSSVRVPSGASARGLEAQGNGRVRIAGAPPFVVDIRGLKVVESDNHDGRVFVVPSRDGKSRIVLSGCENRADGHAECDLRALSGDEELFRARSLSSWGLPVWKNATTFFFVGSSGALFLADCASREVIELEGREMSLCAYLPAHDGLLTSEWGGISLRDPATGRRKRWFVQRNTWTHVGGGALMSPDERYLVYSRKRLLSEIFDAYVQDLETGREARIVPGLFFSSGVWLQYE